MTYEFSLAHLTVLQSSPPELVKIAAAAGYRYVSLRLTPVTPTEPVYPLMKDRRLMKETKRLLAETGVGVLDLELARMDPKTEPETFLPILEAGAELGARCVIGQLPDADRERANQRFARLCDLAAPLGLTIDLEFLPWTDTRGLPEAVSVLEAVKRPNAGVLVDILHFARSNSSLEELKKLPREWFHFVHLCDALEPAPENNEGLIYVARSERYFPGEGGLNPREILACMPIVPYSLEIPHDRRVKECGPEEYARRAIRAAEKYLKGGC
ncbi:MAG: sugar phosphate isomerase/epimerase [Desulfobacteraceae bacterium]|nr:MAG: sugar phosphate isomerase/epimerase [Desulfobacteraceae bacterium]